MRLRALLLTTLAATACGAGSTPDGGTPGGTGGGMAGANPNTVTGMVNGRALDIRSASGQRFTGPGYEGLVIRLSEHEATCNPSATIGVAASDKRVVTIRVQNAPDAGAVAPGQRTGRLSVAVPNCSVSMSSSAGFVSQLAELDFAGNASVSLVNLTGSAKGSFTANLASGASLSGTFDAAFCNFYDFENTSYVKCP